MNGPSISRRPVGQQAIGQPPGNMAPQQQPFFPGPPTASMSAGPTYTPSQMSNQSASYQAGPYYTPTTTAGPPMSGQPPVIQTAAQAHWPSSTTTYQNQGYSPAPPQTTTYVPAPAQTPVPRPSQSPLPPMAHAAQIRASMIVPTTQPGPPGSVGSHPGQMASPTPSMVQNYQFPTNINVVNSPQSTPMPAPSPIPPQLQRLNTTNSVQSLASDFDRRLSLTSNASVGTPLTSFSTPDHTQQAAGTPDGNARSCSSCKQAIPQNLSVFTCLVCSTAEISTHICVWCYTTGAAASSHPHDTSYLAADSDLRVQERIGYILPSQWTIRKNASGRLWYTYNETGYRTHIQPLTGVVYEMDVDVGIPSGWQQMKSPEGKVYYYNPSTHASSWTKPKNEIPQGWKVYKTPDGVLFYVHETLRLSTWDRPGQQPMPRATKPSPTGTPASTPGTSGPLARVSSNNQVKPDRAGKSAAKMVMAANVANNVAKLSAASDMSPAGFLTAGVAAAKLTGLGLKVAGKKVGNLGKRKNMYAAASLIGAAATVTGVLDGDYDGPIDGGYFQADDSQDIEEVEVAQTTEISTDQATYFATESQPTFLTTEQTLPQQETLTILQNQFLQGQQSSYLSDQTSYSYDQSLGMPPDQVFGMPPDQTFGTQSDPVLETQPAQTFGMQSDPILETQPTQSFGVQSDTTFETQPVQTFGMQPDPVLETQPNQSFGMQPDQVQQPMSQEPAVMTSSINVTVQETLVTDPTAQDSQYIESISYVNGAQNTDLNQYVRQDAVITDFTDLSWADPPSLCNPQDIPAAPEPQFITTQVQQSSDVIADTILQSLLVQQPLIMEQPQTAAQPQNVQPPQNIQQPQVPGQPAMIQPHLVTSQPDGLQKPPGNVQPAGVQQPLGHVQPHSVQQPLSHGQPHSIQHTHGNVQPHSIQHHGAKSVPEATSPPPPPPASTRPPQYPENSEGGAPISQVEGAASPSAFEPVSPAPLSINHQ